MGTTYTMGATRSDIIAEITATWDRGNGNTVRNLAKFTSGNTLWRVNSEFDQNGVEIEGTRWIGCTLLKRDGSYGWGHKDMDETMAPGEVSCPLKYLEMVPDPGYRYDGTPWRDRVRAYWAQKAVARGVKDGDIIKLASPASWPSIGLTAQYFQQMSWYGKSTWFAIIGVENGEVVTKYQPLRLSKWAKQDMTVISLETLGEELGAPKQ